MSKTIGESCNRSVVSSSAGASVAQAAGLMRRHHVGDVVVIENQRGVDVPIGIVTDRDIVVEVVAAGLDANAVTVGDLLPRRLEAIDERDSTAEAIRRMSQAGVRRLPVVDLSGVLVGIVTVDDLLPELATQLFMLADVANRGRRVEASLRR
jgi:CBS domain-containing protein